MFRILMSDERVDDVESDLLMVPFFQEEKPPRGDAGWVDWRLYGKLSHWLLEGKIVDRPFESLLLTSEGKFRSPWILLVGLGSPPFTMRGKDWMAHILRIGLRLRVRSLAVSLSFSESIRLPVREMGEGILEAIESVRSIPLKMKDRILILVAPLDLLRAMASSLDLLRSVSEVQAEMQWTPRGPR